MPTAAQYEHAARLVEARSRSVIDLARRLEHLGAAAFVARGPLADRHDDGIATLRAQLLGVVDDLSALARECRRRAEVCHHYATRRRAYEQLDVLARIAIEPPAPPAPWVEA